jgi:hypothetical protein
LAVTVCESVDRDEHFQILSIRIYPVVKMWEAQVSALAAIHKFTALDF